MKIEVMKIQCEYFSTLLGLSGILFSILAVLFFSTDELALKMILLTPGVLGFLLGIYTFQLNEKLALRGTAISVVATFIAMLIIFI